MKKITYQEMLDGKYDYRVASELVYDAMFMEEHSTDYQVLVHEYSQDSFLINRYFNPEALCYMEEYQTLMITQGNCLDVHDIIKALRVIEDSKDLQFLDEFISSHVPLQLIDDYTVKVKPTILSYGSTNSVNGVNPFRQQWFGDYFIPDLVEAVRNQSRSDYYKDGARMWINSCCDYLNTGSKEFASYILGGNNKEDVTPFFCDRYFTFWKEDYRTYPLDEDTVTELRTQFALALADIHQMLYISIERFFELLESELTNIINRIIDYKKQFIYEDTYLQHHEVFFLVDDSDNITHIVDNMGNSLPYGFVDSHF